MCVQTAFKGYSLPDSCNRHTTDLALRQVQFDPVVSLSFVGALLGQRMRLTSPIALSAFRDKGALSFPLALFITGRAMCPVSQEVLTVWMAVRLL